MARLVFRGFAGMMPKIAPLYLQSGQATNAVNCRLGFGSMLPWKGLSASVKALAKSGEIKTIYRWGAVPNDSNSGFWFHWNERVNVVRGPVAADVDERTYFTGTDKPRMTYNGLATSGGGQQYPTVSKPLGVPYPSIGPVATVTGAANSDVNPQYDTVSRSYVVTYVTNLGEEGPPSDPSNIVDWLPGQAVDLSSIPGAIAGEWNLVTKNIYRAEGGSGGVDYYLVGSIPLAQTTFTDSVEQVGRALVSYQYYEPPEDMHGLGVLPSGFAYGFSKNQVCVSEPYLLHAWDPDIRKTTTEDIIGGGHFGDSIVALTTRNPYVITGQDPRSMSMDELKINQGCVSALSIVSTRLGVIYASPDGLMMIGPNGAINLLENYLRREQWQAYKPESVRGVFFDEYYFAFYDTGSEQGALLLKPSMGESGLIKLSLYATAYYADPLQDKLFVVVGSNIHKFDDGSDLAMTWTSGEVFQSRLTDYTCMQVLAKSYVNTYVKLLVDGVQAFNIKVNSSAMVRVPVLEGHRFQVEISSGSEVESVALSTTPSELLA